VIYEEKEKGTGTEEFRVGELTEVYELAVNIA
jgi:hypothetical protein